MKSNLPSLRYKPVLTNEERLFVDRYVVSQDAYEAAAWAGLAPGAAEGYLKRNTVRAALEVAFKARAGRMRVDQDLVLKTWLDMFQVDAREFAEHWRVACRHCWGHDNRFQFTDLELSELLTVYRAAHKLGASDRKAKSFKAPAVPHLKLVRDQIDSAFLSGQIGIDPEPFDDLGGDGYTILKAPARGEDWVRWVKANSTGIREPEATARTTCPACYGFGVQHLHVHDTREYSKAAARMFEGVEQTADDGFKIMTRRRADVEALLARHLGYFVERKIVLVGDVNQLGEEELRKRIAEADAEYQRLIELEPGPGGFALPEGDELPDGAAP